VGGGIVGEGIAGGGRIELPQRTALRGRIRRIRVAGPFEMKQRPVSAGRIGKMNLRVDGLQFGGLQFGGLQFEQRRRIPRLVVEWRRRIPRHLERRYRRYQSVRQ
jgi:hypothetical protein